MLLWAVLVCAEIAGFRRDVLETVADNFVS